MNIEVLNTGSELMLGRVLNTHQQWLCRRLADLGYVVDRQVAVADQGTAILAAVREALGRADLVITTGGLGPTSDDVTRDLIAGLLGRKLVRDEAIAARITDFFAERRRPMPASTLVQALVPEGALVLPNAHGTAPGLVLEVKPNPFRPDGKVSWLVMLPGPPRELHPMFTSQVVPLLLAKMPLESAFVCRTLKTTGIGESQLEELISAPLDSLVRAGLELGYCARVGEVDLRFVARGPGGAAAVAEAEHVVTALAGKHIYGFDDENLESVVVWLLTGRGQSMALAESCTGGFIAHRLTNVPGASAVFLAGMVTYSNTSKQIVLGVRAETLAAHGAVSEPVAAEMAAGARRVTGADYALAVTGIAGPGGGTTDKPVGTVFIALAARDGVAVIRQLNRFDRETFKQVTSQQALEMLRRRLVS